MALQFDPAARPDPDLEKRQRDGAARVEIRPAVRSAHLGVRSLACPECGVPVVIAGAIGWNQALHCSFCDSVAPTSAYVQRHGYPAVDVIARLA
jgi:hypothetical protein